MGFDLRFIYSPFRVLSDEHRSTSAVIGGAFSVDDFGPRDYREDFVEICVVDEGISAAVARDDPEDWSAGERSKSAETDSLELHVGCG